MTTRPDSPGHRPDVLRLPLRPEPSDDPLSEVPGRLPVSTVIVQGDKPMLRVTDELAMLFNRRLKS